VLGYAGINFLFRYLSPPEKRDKQSEEKQIHHWPIELPSTPRA
jgi:hypothetical protein